MKKYLSDAEVAERYGVHRATIWRWSQAGIFPKPIQIAPGTTRWKLEDVERVDAEREREARA
jgi:predicted DNA-binding transcriptional regulator AlpA